MPEPASEETRHLIRGASLSRVVAFSDGVVAVAITVLVLPLVSLGVPDGSTSPWAIITDHWTTFFSYIITFIIVFILWQGHHRVFENFRAIDGPIMWLNGLWLLTIGILPWPSRLIDIKGSGQEVVWLYCLTLCLNSLLLHAIYQRGRRHPELLKDPEGVGLLAVGEPGLRCGVRRAHGTVLPLPHPRDLAPVDRHPDPLPPAAGRHAAPGLLPGIPTGIGGKGDAECEHRGHEHRGGQ